jgi:hypothetical protein
VAELGEAHGIGGGEIVAQEDVGRLVALPRALRREERGQGGGRKGKQSDAI